MSINIPYPKTDTLLSNYKVSKRRDEDISSVCASFYFTISKNIITDARLVFGGMDSVPKRARYAEKFLIGKPWSQKSIFEASNTFQKDLHPISDARASKEYRTIIARNLLRRFFAQKSKGYIGLTRHGNALAG